MSAMRSIGARMVDKLHEVQLNDDSSADLEDRLDEIDAAIQRFGYYMNKVTEKDLAIKTEMSSN
jgi:hypothetical protein